MRFNNIDVLRAIAAIMVTLFHLTGATPLNISLGSYAQYGFLGVEIFFIISGFVLPYSMYRSNYKPRQFFTFIISRVIRIYPAFIASILIGITVAMLTGRNTPTIKQFLEHLIFVDGSISPVFWTLAIEFQFYLLIGLIPFLFSPKIVVSIALVALSACSFFFKENTIFYWMPFFTLGILCFKKLFNDLSSTLYFLLTAITLLVIIKTHGIIYGIVSVATILAILYMTIKESSKAGRLLTWLGSISYSLYLTHWELGRAAISASRRIPIIGSIDIVRLILGFLFSIFSAWLLYTLVEKPAILLSKKYKKRQIT